jgi:cytochrome b6-f complex iron-sulfur subunit
MAERSSGKSIKRRDLLAGILNLAWIAPLALGLVQMIRFLGFNPPDAQPTHIPLGAPGALSTFPVYLEKGRVWLMKDAGGFYALDAICTHLGCIVGQGKTGVAFECPCHGSHFTIDGSVVNGPATQPLPHLRLSRGDDGQIEVNRSQPVDAGSRLSLS